MTFWRTEEKKKYIYFNYSDIVIMLELLLHELLFIIINCLNIKIK